VSANLSKEQQNSSEKIAVAKSLVIFEKTPEVGTFVNITVERSTTALQQPIQYDPDKVDKRAADAIRTAEQAVEKLCRASGLINPYYHLGLQCSLDRKCTGASLGLAVFAAILAVLAERSIGKEFAFTGEIKIADDGATMTLEPVAYLDSKLTAASDNAPIQRVILPKLKEEELCQLQEKFSDLDLIGVSELRDIPSLLFERAGKHRFAFTVRRLQEEILAQVAEEVPLRSFHYDRPHTYRKVTAPEDRKRLIEQFYHGQVISLAAIHNGLAVSRVLERDLLDWLLTDSRYPRLGMIFADPYQGKTTLLRCLQYRLLGKQKVVLWKRPSHQLLEIGEVEKFYGTLADELGDEPIYLLIDDLDSYSNCETFLEELADSRVRVIVVATSSLAKTSRPIFQRFNAYHTFWERRLWFMPQEKLTFIQKLQEAKLLGASFTPPQPDTRHRKQLIKFFSSIGLVNLGDYYGALVLDKVKQLDTQFREGVYLICSLYVFNISMPVSLFTSLQQDRDSLLARAGAVIVPESFAKEGSPEYLRVASPQIARRILDYAGEVSQQDRRGRWEQILRHITTETSTAVNLCRALAQTYDFQSFVASPTVRAIIEQLLPRSSWQEMLWWGDVYRCLGLDEPRRRCLQRAVELLKTEGLASRYRGYTRIGHSLYDAGDYPGAREQFLQAHALFRTVNFPYWKVAACYEKEGKPYKAMLFYVKSARLERTSQGYGTALHRVRALQPAELDSKRQRTLTHLRLRLARRAVDADPHKAKNHSDLGDEYKNARQYSAACEAFKKSIDLEDYQNYPYYQIGACYEACGELEEAKAWYRKGAQVEYSTTQSLRCYQKLVFRFLQQGDRQEVVRICADISNLGTAVFTKYANCRAYGEILVALGQYEDALLYLGRAKELLLHATSPETPNYLADLWGTIATCHEALIAFEEAMTAYKECAAYRGDPRTYGIYGHRALVLQMYVYADYFFTESLKREPRNVKNLSQRAEARMKLRDYSGAITDFLEALAIRQDDPTAAFFMKRDQENLLRCLAQTGTPAEEMPMFETKNRNISIAIQGYLGLARLYEKKGSRFDKTRREIEIIDESATEKACEAYERATQRNNDATAWGRYGYKLFQLKRPLERIETAFRRALQMDPSHFYSLHRYGYVLLRVQQYSPAIEQLSQAIAVGSAALQVSASHDQTREGSGNEDKKALADQLSMAYQNRGQAYTQLQQYDQAIADYTCSLEYVNNGQACLKIAHTLEDMGADELAMEAYAKATQCSDEDFSEAFESEAFEVAAASVPADELTYSYEEERAVTTAAASSNDTAALEISHPTQRAVMPPPREEEIEESLQQYLKLSQTYEQAGKIPLALALCDKAIELAPHDLRAQLQKVRLALKDGQKREAETILRSLVERLEEIETGGLKSQYDEYWAEILQGN
jgi:tetratricopeptide (TPR) repeat protein